MDANRTLCYNCKDSIDPDASECSHCQAPIIFDLVSESMVEFMTEITHPHMTPRSDNG